MSFKEPIPALSNVMDTNEHASSRPDCGAWKDVAIGFELTGDRGLEVLGPGAVAHMSLHQKLTMSKSHSTKQADSKGAPIFTGGPAIRQCWRPLRSEPVRNRQRRVGERPYMGGFESGQRLFAILFHKSEITAEFRHFHDPFSF